MKRIFFFIAASYLIMINYSYTQHGSTGLAFLKNGTGARISAMGEVSSIPDPACAFYNPAVLSYLEGVHLHFTHKTLLQDMQTDYLAATAPWKSLTFGLSINSTSIDDIELRTIPGEPAGYFSAKNIAIGLTASLKTKANIAIGMTAKYLYEKIYVDEASGYAFDIGGFYETPWKINIIFAVNNIGAMNSLKDEPTILPLALRLGTGYTHPWETIGGAVSISGDIVSYPREKTVHLHAGTEFILKNVIALRAGYITGVEARSISAGLGVHHGILAIDYAFIPYNNNFSTSHTISVGIIL